MNYKALTKKLQKAILNTGLVIKINTYQFYSKEQKRMIEKYQITTPVFQKNKLGEWKNKDFEILSTCSVIEIIKCLNDIYQAMKYWEMVE